MRCRAHSQDPRVESLAILTWWFESNTCNPLFPAVMIFSGSAVHLNGFASLQLCSLMNRRMATSHSVTELKPACFRRRLVSFAKNPSTAFSLEDEVGVKWNVRLGCRAGRCGKQVAHPRREWRQHRKRMDWRPKRCRSRRVSIAISGGSVARSMAGFLLLLHPALHGTSDERKPCSAPWRGMEE